MIHHQDDHLTVHIGDCREVMAGLPAESVHCVVTSPPYWGLRDYGVEGAIGLEPTPEAFIAAMVDVFREVKRVLRKDGTLWLNMGDSYANTGSMTGGTSSFQPPAPMHSHKHAMPFGLKPKDLVGMPWRLAFALQADGWYLRSDIIWSKPNPMPESVTDRPTKAHEYVFLLTKSARYYYDAEAVREPHTTPGGMGWAKATATQDSMKTNGDFTKPRDRKGLGMLSMSVDPAGRNLRSVWQIATEPYPGAHFATFPQKLVEPCIKAGTSERGVCPECGAPWVRMVNVGELVPTDDRNRQTFTQPKYQNGGDGKAAALDGSTFQSGFRRDKTTTGWAPSCDHGLEPTSATVLDPFAGSGTTGLVANRLGRRAILIDLSADYIDQAMLRNQQHPLGLIG